MPQGTKKLIKNFIFYSGIFSFFLFSFISPLLFDVPEIYLKNLAVLILTATLWITGVIPPAVTGLLIISITALFNIMSAERTFSAFGNRAIFFLLSCFIMSSALLKTGLARKFSSYFLKFLSKRPFFVISGIFSISFFFSLIMPEHATALIIFPFLLTISRSIKSKKYEKLIFLSMVWGAVSGGVGTPLGGARAPFAIGLYQENFNKSITFFDWTIHSIPISLIFYISGIIYIFFISKDISEEIEVKSVLLKLDEEEIKTVFVYLFAIILWVFFSHKIDMAVTGLLSSFLLFVLRVITWRDAQHYVNWGIILMYGGAIVLGASLYQSGTANFISDLILKPLGKSPIFLFLCLILLTLFLTEFISNVATCALILPVAYGFTDIFDPFFITITIGISSGLGFVLPYGSTPNALSYSSGKYSIYDAFKYSFFFLFLSPITIFIVAKFLWQGI